MLPTAHEICLLSKNLSFYVLFTSSSSTDDKNNFDVSSRKSHGDLEIRK